MQNVSLQLLYTRDLVSCIKDYVILSKCFSSLSASIFSVASILFIEHTAAIVEVVIILGTSCLIRGVRCDQWPAEQLTCQPADLLTCQSADLLTCQPTDLLTYLYETKSFIFRNCISMWLIWVRNCAVVFPDNVQYHVILYQNSWLVIQYEST